MAKETKSKKLKPEKEKGVMTTLKVAMYKGHNVYIRRVYEEYFEYLLFHNNEIYSSYVLMQPKEGQESLTKKEVSLTINLIYAGAESTIDQLIENEGNVKRRKKITKR